MLRLSARLLATMSLLALAACPAAEPRVPATAVGAAPPAGWTEHRAANPQPSAAYRWVDVMLAVAGDDVVKVSPRPTILSRQMAIPMTAMYDAWAAYDERAVGTRLGATLRRPAAERTQANKEVAISYAMYRTLVDIFPADKARLDAEMTQRGLDPADASVDPATPQGVGNLAARAVLDHRKDDGANQRGDVKGGDGTPYGDYTGYAPVNTATAVSDPDRWQPIPFSDGKGGTVAPGNLTPHWHLVKPFALERADQFRPGPQPKVGSPELARDVAEVIEMNGHLSLDDKALVEFMRDGPRSTGQSGHWMQFAQDVSRRDHYDLDRDVKLFFAVATTAADAFIAAWDAKRAYDSSRPWTLVRHLQKGKTAVGYLGPCRGFGPVPAERWQPYSPDTFVTPPFPGYVSGHSTVSGACARMLEHLTGSDRFEVFERRQAGELTEPGCSPAQMQAQGGRPDPTAPATSAVVVKLPAFSVTADLAGRSRVLGGYHIQADNSAGLALGRAVADWSFTRFQAYFDGTATVTP